MQWRSVSALRRATAMTTAAEEQANAHGYYARDAEVEGLKTQLAEARQAIGAR